MEGEPANLPIHSSSNLIINNVKTKRARGVRALFYLKEKLFNNFLSGDTGVGDNADEVAAIAEVAHIDGVGGGGHNNAAVEVEDVDFLEAFSFDVEDADDGVGVDSNVGNVSIVDGVLTSGDSEVVENQPVTVNAFIVTEAEADGLTSELREVDVLNGEVSAGRSLSVDRSVSGEVAGLSTSGGDIDGVLVTIHLADTTDIVSQVSTISGDNKFGGDHPLVGSEDADTIDEGSSSDSAAATMDIL